MHPFLPRSLRTLPLVLATLIAGSSSLLAANYYVDNNAANGSNSGPGTQAQPWKNLAAINSRTFSAGDVISFKAGSSYSGAFTLSSSGTSSSKIRLTAYGSGAKPTFSNPGQLYTLNITGDHVEVDGLKFTNSTTMSVFNDTTYRQSGAILIRQGADFVAVKNCEITQVGVGVKSYGLSTAITGNDIYDLVIAYTDSEQSYGAIGVSLNNSDALVAHNRFVNCRSTNSPYGADGGAIEIEGYTNNKNNIVIRHNRSTGSQGFIEVTETQATNVLIHTNLSDDYQQFLAFDTTVTPSNFRVEHNTVIRTQSSNTTNVFTILYYRESGPTPTNSWLNIRNNVFYTPTCKVLKGTYTYREYNFPHSNNVYYDGSSDPVGYPLGPGDVIAPPNFVNLSARDYHLTASSPARDAGASLGYTTDLDGNPRPVGAAPDCGAYEFQGTATPAPAGLLDAGFENQTSSTLGAPWSKSGPGYIGVDYNAGKARTGLHNAYIATTSSGQWNEITQTITVSPNSTYRLSAYVRSSANLGTNLWIGLRNLAGGNKREAVFTPTGSYALYTVSNTYTTGPSETSIVLFVGYISPSGTAWIHLDDVACTKL